MKLKLKVYIGYYWEKGKKPEAPNYIWLRAPNIKDAKADVKTFIHRDLREKGRGAVQINDYMKSLVIKIVKK